MKVVFVIDSLTDIKNKLSLFDSVKNNVLYLVYSPFEEIIKTYGITPNAVYTNKLAYVLHMLLKANGAEDVIIYYTSFNLTNQFLQKFVQAIGDKKRVVNVLPDYNGFEKMYNACYNRYVKSVFKLSDGLASPKLQFLPKACVEELLQSHIANRMFQLMENKSISISPDNKEDNKTLKVKNKFNKFNLLPIIVTLLITAGLLTALAFFKPSFILIFSFVALYIINILVYTVFNFKDHFDNRFLK